MVWTAAAAGKFDGPQFVATPADLAVDRHPSRPADATSRPNVANLIARLRLDRVTLDGRPIQVDPEPIGLVAKSSMPRPVRLFVEQDTRIVNRGSERHRPGRRHAPSARAQQAHGPRARGPAARPFLLGRRPRRPRDRSHPGSREADSARDRVPEAPDGSPRRPGPRIRIEVHRDGDGLSVLPTLVYGDPPVARRRPKASSTSAAARSRSGWRPPRTRWSPACARARKLSRNRRAAARRQAAIAGLGRPPWRWSARLVIGTSSSGATSPPSPSRLTTTGCPSADFNLRPDADPDDDFEEGLGDDFGDPKLDRLARRWQRRPVSVRCARGPAASRSSSSTAAGSRGCRRTGSSATATGSRISGGARRCADG